MQTKKAITYHPSPEAVKLLACYRGRGEVSRRIDFALLQHAVMMRVIGVEDHNSVNKLCTMLIRYRAICKLDCPEMSENEWMACCDVMNGTWREAENYITDPAKFIGRSIKDSEDDGMGEKWGIDCKEFSARLDGMAYSSLCAIMEVVNRWWSDIETDYPSDKDRLIAAGAKVLHEH